MTARMTPLLSARAITKQFGGRNGCRNVSFDLYPGEVLCIVGESGSGKTTLLNTLALRTEADSGTLHYHATHGDMLDLRALSEPRRQYRRAADGSRRAPLRPDSPYRDAMDGARRTGCHAYR
jgi:putative phosphonate transport system ATP-binding protein